MKLIKFNIMHFRSLRDVRLTDCGDFNVLIGKNNAGKSNVLTAIDMFFSILSGAEIVSDLDSIGHKHDFSKRDVSSDITLNPFFRLADKECDELLKSLIKENPNLQRAIDTLPRSCDLSIEILICGSPNRFAYVSKIALVEQSEKNKSWPLLEVPKEFAKELLSTLTTIKRAAADKKALTAFLSGFDRDEWKRAKATSTERMGLFRLRRFPEVTNPDLYRKIQNLVSDIETFDQFKSAVQDLLASAEEVETLAKASQLNVPIRSFAGEVRTIPGYVKSILRSAARIKILYLTERREEIGVEEAQKLLTLKMRRGGGETLRNIQATVSELLGVKVDAFAAEDDADEDTEENAELDVDGYLAEINGSGIREGLRLVSGRSINRCRCARPPRRATSTRTLPSSGAIVF